ncbi:MAG: alpha/beta hydrolase [Alphaproteobacteria bacterium]|nr:alpha/beta hydrolase [Alphaproteobacteria bacterium]
MALPNPVIVVPGITATYLVDEYPLPPEVIWKVLGGSKDFVRSALHPDSLRYELKEPARVQPGQIYEVAYRELIEELRHNLTPVEDQPVPVFPFSYDWRLPLDASEGELSLFVVEVIERTLLLKHYYGDAEFRENPKVNLVGHSMGGLIIAGYLKRAGEMAPVGKVVSLASPFRGSLEPVLKITTGMADLGTGAAGSRDREAARLTPALYQLLPSFAGALVTRGNAPGDLLKPDAWQPGLINTLTDFIKLHGRSPKNPREKAERLFSAILQQAREHRMRLENFSLNDAGLGDDDWLCVVGIGAKTRMYIESKLDQSGNVEFEINSSQRFNEGTKTGDGTVPLPGALPAFVPANKVVCIDPDDYGYWEIQDKAMTKIAGFHGILPNMNMLHRMIVRFFTGADNKHGNTWGRVLPGIDKAEWDPPLDLGESQ